MKKRFICILPNLNAGGAEMVALNYLRQLNSDKYEITLVVFKISYDLMSLVPKEINLVNLKSFSTVRSFWPLLKLIKEIKPNIVFTTHSRVATLVMMLKPWAPKFKHIARMQNTPSLEKRHNAYGKVTRILYAAGFRSADVVVSQTEEMKEDAVNVFGLKKTRVKVLRNPIDYKVIDGLLRQQVSPFPRNQVSAVASGRLAYQKGFDVLIKSLPTVIAEHPNFFLYILGNDNGELVKLESIAEELGLTNNLRFIGFQSNPYPYYKFCDLFILSSRWEGFPNALLENYYLNTPIAATRCVPIVDSLVDNNKNGFSCMPEDISGLSAAILKALSIDREKISVSHYCGGNLESVI